MSKRPLFASYATWMLACASAIVILAIYQLYALARLELGESPICSMNSTFDCASVWTSDFARRIHDLAHMPLAALGAVYGVTGMALAALLLRAENAGGDRSPWIAGARVWGVVGVIACAVFGAVSVSEGAACITCIATYVLTLAYAVLAVLAERGTMLPASAALIPGVGTAIAVALATYVALRVIGMPKSVPASVAVSEAEVRAEVARLPPDARAFLSTIASTWIATPPLDNAAYRVRRRIGPANAKLAVVDFIDILCPHCRVMDELIDGYKSSGGFSLEQRFYPLDNECNPYIRGSAGDGVRCLAAKILICLEDKPGYEAARKTFFENQSRLGRNELIALASGAANVPDQELSACAQSPDTDKSLRDDIEYAQRYKPEGTPILIFNGKSATPWPLFIRSVFAANGDAASPLIRELAGLPAQ